MRSTAHPSPGPRASARRLRALIFAALASMTLLACVAASASAAVVHEFLPAPTAELTTGVPAGCGTGESEPPCIAGGLSGVNALTADSEGQLWVAERMGAGKNLGKSRVDAFDDQSGKFLPAGSESPQLDEEGGVEHFFEAGVAVGHPEGEREVYVGAGQASTNVVAVFGPNGKLQHAWTGASTPAKTFGSHLRGVAVSTNLGSENELFVVKDGAPREKTVDVFAPAAGGEEPAGVLGQIRGPETPCVAGQQGCVNPTTREACEPEETGCATSFVEPHGVAVSPLNGDVFVADGPHDNCVHGVAGAECVVDVFEPSGVPGAYTFAFRIAGAPGEPFRTIGPMAVDREGDVYVLEKGKRAGEGRLDQFDAAGQFVTRLAGTPQGVFKSLQSVAADPSSGNVYVGELDEVQQTGAVDVFGPSLIVPDVATSGGEARVRLGPGGEGELEATLKGTVNPVGEGPATCRFAWGASRAFGRLAACEAEVPEGNSPVPVQGTIGVGEGLEPDTTYSFRLQATDKNGTNPGEEEDDRELHTPGPGIHSTSSSDVAATSATLDASIDPNGAPSSFFFQYGTSSGYGSQSSPLPFGSGHGDVPVSFHAQGLSPLSEYHYRVVAVSTLEVEGSQQSVRFVGPDETFKTLGANAGTLDGRRWELVSPPDKHGAQLLPIGLEEGGAIQAAAGGGAATYIATLPTEEGVEGYIYGGVQVFSMRGAAGWSSKDLVLPHSGATGIPVGVGKEFRSFSPDLCSATVEEEGFGEFIPLTGEAFPPATQRTPLVRHNCTCPSAPSECFEPLLTTAPGYADIPEGTPFGSGSGGSEHEGVVGSSGDLSHVIVNSRVPLTGLKEAEGREELYEWSGDRAPGQRLALVSVLPKEEGKELAADFAELGFQNEIVRHAVSEDGARVVWSGFASHHLYLRDTVKERSVQLDLPEAQCLAKGECGEAEAANAQFQLASSDGSRVLFTDTQRLTGNAGRTGTADLYECRIEEVAGEPTCRLTDLTPAPGPGQSADVQGAVAGASEDGSWVYFIANGLLGDAAARGATNGDCVGNGLPGFGHGQCNLYVYREGETRFIATVAGADYPDWTGVGGFDLSKQTARVSPDGRWLSFMSQRSLTGYDNEDVTSKAPGERPDEEVFLYHAQEGEAGRLVCASCDPSGARPTGVEYAALSGTNNSLVGGSKVWDGKTWIAANVPAWNSYFAQHALYQPRYLSNSGRVFFNSNDALVDQDGNNNQDVYEFEPLGAGSCSSGSSGFIASRDGCLGLISSGTAGGESAFLDASESGEDVFFLTAGQLVPGKDHDNALDVYDAHSCSAASRCPEELAEPPACITAESCRPAPTPQPGIFGAPASATFSGPGNLTPAAPAPMPAPKKPPLTAKQKLAKALNVCRHKYTKVKKRLLHCEREAHKHYGRKSKPNKKAKRKGSEK